MVVPRIGRIAPNRNIRKMDVRTDLRIEFYALVYRTLYVN